MWNIKVPVTKEHIEQSIMRDSRHCMIADAIHSRLKWASYVTVDTQSIRFNNKKHGKRYIFLTPPEAQKAIVLYDQGVRIKPFKFTLAAGYMKQKQMRAVHKRKTDRASRKPRTHSIPKMSQYREFGMRKMTK